MQDEAQKGSVSRDEGRHSQCTCVPGSGTLGGCWSPSRPGPGLHPIQPGPRWEVGALNRGSASGSLLPRLFAHLHPILGGSCAFTSFPRESEPAPKATSHTRLDPPPYHLEAAPSSPTECVGLLPQQGSLVGFAEFGSSRSCLPRPMRQSSSCPEHGQKLVFVAEAGAGESGLLKQQRA